MQATTQTLVGCLLMAGCGSAIANQFGFNLLQTVLLAGFAVGISLLAQIPALKLRERVAQLEAQIAASDKPAT